MSDLEKGCNPTQMSQTRLEQITMLIRNEGLLIVRKKLSSTWIMCHLVTNETVSSETSYQD